MTKAQSTSSHMSILQTTGDFEQFSGSTQRICVQQWTMSLSCLSTFDRNTRSSDKGPPANLWYYVTALPSTINYGNMASTQPGTEVFACPLCPQLVHE